MTSLADPLVTVLMPVFNCGPYLRGAIDSVLCQTISHLELLIIDDGSSDDSSQIVESYRDRRIRFVRNGRNLGLIETLNRGLDMARGKYLARMDGDDISLPNRLETQIAFMEANSSVDICGGWIATIGDVRKRVLKYPVGHEAIRAKLLFESALAHPTVLFRRDSLSRTRLRYDKKFIRVEDYELWVRAAGNLILANIPRILLRYRMHTSNVGALHRDEQHMMAARVRMRQLNELDIDISEREQDIHESISRSIFQKGRTYIEACEAWLLKVNEANRAKGYYAELELAKVLGDKWASVCASAAYEGGWAVKKYFSSPLSRDGRLISRQEIKVLWKSVKTVWQ